MSIQDFFTPVLVPREVPSICDPSEKSPSRISLQAAALESGMVGAYDYKDDQIEVGFSVVPGWQGRGLATEALKKVLEYLTKNEGIPCMTAWCAAENIGSKRVLEKAGMKLVGVENGGLTIGDRVYDKLIYEYRQES